MANDTFTGGFSAGDILYEDNHLIAVNKRAGQLVQSLSLIHISEPTRPY